MILWLADAAAKRGLPYVYLGYWIADSSKMAYKRAFRPLEFFGPEGWTELPARVGIFAGACERLDAPPAPSQHVPSASAISQAAL